MKAIVCVKQVPDTSGKVAVNPDGTLNRASMETITNPDDLNAVEAALKLKDETGCKVVAVSYTHLDVYKRQDVYRPVSAIPDRPRHSAAPDYAQPVA